MGWCTGLSRQQPVTTVVLPEVQRVAGHRAFVCFSFATIANLQNWSYNNEDFGYARIG
jgi:hypothetical protein